MFESAKKTKITFRPELFTIRWYPSSRSFGGTRPRKFQPNLMPPLMVRKAEWRR